MVGVYPCRVVGSNGWRRRRLARWRSARSRAVDAALADCAARGRRHRRGGRSLRRAVARFSPDSPVELAPLARAPERNATRPDKQRAPRVNAPRGSSFITDLRDEREAGGPYALAP